jgi:hypothetical protein
MADAADLLPGTLDLLVPKALSLEPMHGWGVGQRIDQLSALRHRPQPRRVGDGRGPLRCAALIGAHASFTLSGTAGRDRGGRGSGGVRANGKLTGVDHAAAMARAQAAANSLWRRMA